MKFNYLAIAFMITLIVMILWVTGRISKQIEVDRKLQEIERRADSLQNEIKSYTHRTDSLNRVIDSLQILYGVEND